MSHIEHIQIKQLKDAISDLLQNIEYIEEYGYVGCYELKPEEISEKSLNAINLIRQADDNILSINISIRNSFEY